MKQFVYLLAFVATFALASCEKITPTPEFQGFNFSNPENREGTYRIIGPRGFISQGKSLRTPPPGEYQVYFISQKLSLTENTCTITGYEPIFIGSTTFIVSDTNETGTTISVPIRQISSYIHFKRESKITITDALLIGTSESILLDGQFPNKVPIKNVKRQLEDQNGCYVIASKITIQVQCQFNNHLHQFEKEISLSAGDTCNICVTEYGINVN